MPDPFAKQSTAHNIEAVFFDIGGVIFPLGGLKDMIDFLPKGETLQSIRDKWIASLTVMNFESGKITEDEFAGDIVKELKLGINPEDFLHIFKNWSVDASNETMNLLKNITGRFTSATLSNTNHLHWNKIAHKLEGLFDCHFPSHITGFLKPDPEAFLNAARSINQDPGKIIFFDDTEINVESAKRSGFQAFCVKSVADAAKILLRLGITI